MRIKPLDSLSTVKVRALLVQLLSESIIFSRQYRIFSAEGDNRNQSSSTATSSYGFDQRSLYGFQISSVFHFFSGSIGEDGDLCVLC